MKTETSIIFTGDIGFDRYMLNKWEDDQLLSKPILEFFNSADHVCANVEGALIDVPDDGTRSVCFHAMNPGATKVLQKMHADIWSIGNNHTMDAEEAGVISTQKIAKELGCQVIGAGLNIEEASRPVYLDEAGGIGLLGISYMPGCHSSTANSPGILPWDDIETISARIEEIKAKCRWCVIVCHGGEEFTCLPMPYTRDRYIQFLELGADVVISHHPHVAENYELFDNNKMIFYSLGNFIFDTDYQRAHPYTDIGVLVKLHFTEHDVSFEAIGTKIIRGLEHIDIAPLPDIFTNITESDYNLLYPLAAKGLIIDERRRMIYLKPEKYTECSSEDWMAHLLDKEYEEYADGMHMDMFKVTKWANMTDSGLWKKCSLEAVKHYILQQFEIPYPVEYR